MKKFEVVFSSNIGQVNKVVKDAQDYIRQNLPIVNSDELFDLRLILSELLVNAVIHGNKNNQNKLVRLTLSVENNTVYASVCDQGEGFDYNRLKDSDEPSVMEHGRGISLVRALADSITFKKSGQKILFSKRVGFHV